MAFPCNSLPALESVKIISFARERNPAILEKQLQVFAKAAKNLRSLSLAQHQSSTSLSAAPFIENCSRLEVIVMKDGHGIIDELLKNIWEKLPNLKFFYSKDSLISTPAAKSLILNYDLFILCTWAGFYFKSHLPLSRVKKFVSQQSQIHDLSIHLKYSIFTF